jgi:hypothetical protein
MDGGRRRMVNGSEFYDDVAGRKMHGRAGIETAHIRHPGGAFEPGPILYLVRRI